MPMILDRELDFMWMQRRNRGQPTTECIPMLQKRYICNINKYVYLLFYLFQLPQLIASQFGFVDPNRKSISGHRLFLLF